MAILHRAARPDSRRKTQNRSCLSTVFIDTARRQMSRGLRAGTDCSRHPAEFSEQVPETLFPSVFGQATPPGRLSNPQALLGPPPVVTEQLHQLFVATVTEDFPPNIVMQGQFPVPGRQVAGAGARTLEVASLEGRQGQRGRSETDAQVHQTCPIESF